MRTALFVALLIIAANTPAVGQMHLWSKAFGNADFDQGQSVSTDESGNVFVTGSFTGTVDFALATSTG